MDQDIVLAIVCSTLLILLLVAVVIIVFFISGRQKLKQEMEMEQAKLAFEKELRQVEAEVSEEVKAQFAQELHDNIGQLLTAIHIQIENQKLDQPELAEKYKPVEIYLKDVTQQLRLLSRTMNGDYLNHIGLPAALQLEAERLDALNRFKVHLQSADRTSNLSKGQELIVFRIFQEIAQNALRHSEAKNFYIELNTAGTGFEMKIKDDGKGFDLEETLHSQKASGLRNILKRAKMAGFECNMSTSKGRGTLFHLKKIPSLD